MLRVEADLGCEPLITAEGVDNLFVKRVIISFIFFNIFKARFLQVFRPFRVEALTRPAAAFEYRVASFARLRDLNGFR